MSSAPPPPPPPARSPRTQLSGGGPPPAPPPPALGGPPSTSSPQPPRPPQRRSSLSINSSPKSPTLVSGAPPPPAPPPPPVSSSPLTPKQGPPLVAKKPKGPPPPVAPKRASGIDQTTPTRTPGVPPPVAPKRTSSQLSGVFDTPPTGGAPPPPPPPPLPGGVSPAMPQKTTPTTPVRGGPPPAVPTRGSSTRLSQSRDTPTPPTSRHSSSSSAPPPPAIVKRMSQSSGPSFAPPPPPPPPSVPTFAQNGHKDYDAEELPLSDSHASLASITSPESSITSSRSSRKDDGDYDVPRPSANAPPPPPPPPPIDTIPTTRELVDKLFEGIEDIPEIDPVGSGGDLPSLMDMHTGLLKDSMSSLSGRESVSSSNDNLGVWDDVKFDENISDTSSESNAAGVVMTTPVTDDDDALLDSWLKELEVGTRLSEIASPEHMMIRPPQLQDLTTSMSQSLDTPTLQSDPISFPTSSTATPPPPTSSPPPSAGLPPEPPVPATPTVVPDTPTVSTPKAKQSFPPPSYPAPPPPANETVAVVRRKPTQTQKLLQDKYTSWRVSIPVIQGAEEKDLDELLADLCKLEEDTKAQLAAATGKDSTETEMESPTKVLKGDKVTEGVSSDDFAKFMMSLQGSSNIVEDPGKSLSAGTHTSRKVSSPEPSISDIDLTFLTTEEETPQEKEDNFFNTLQRTSSMAGRSATPTGNTLKRNAGTRRSYKSTTIITNEPHSPTHIELKKQLDDFAKGLEIDEGLTAEEQIQKMKSKKIKEAMSKLKEASLQKVVLKAHNVDGSTKMVAIHEGMTARDVCVMLAERNHQDMGPNWTIVEKIPELHLERVLEDHEKVVDAISHWPRDHTNFVMFKNNPEKYHIIKRPQLLMPAKHHYSSVNPARNRNSFTEEQKKTIILKEIFDQNILPPLEGDLYIREGKKSGWKKHLFVLRASGLYYSKSGRSLASRDIVRVVEWKDVECYTGTQYKKFYKAPGHYCFSLMPYGPLAKVERRIVHMSVATKHDLNAWLTGVRLAKYGAQLKQNYEDTKADLPWLQLEEDTLDNISISSGVEVTYMPTKKADTSTKSNESNNSSAEGSGRLGIPRLLRQGSVENTADSSHVISGPMISNPGNTVSARRNQPANPLANAFKDAWKQGSLASEMKQEEKWPVFQPSPKMDRKKQNQQQHLLQSANGGQDPDLIFEEMSGMVTLKRKTKEKGGNSNGGQLESFDNHPGLQSLF